MLNTNTITLIPEISNWVEDKEMKVHSFVNITTNQQNIIKNFAKRHINYYVCNSEEEKNKMILCKLKETTSMLKH